MSLESNKNDDPVWNTAWAWVTRQHSREGLPEDELRNLVKWIDADAAHRANYERAAKLWLLSGLVPPVNDVPIPGFDDQADSASPPG